MPWTAKSCTDTAAPGVALTFPVNGVNYSATSWNAGCVSSVCGTASDTTLLQSVGVSIRQGTGNYWNGTSFSSG